MSCCFFVILCVSIICVVQGQNEPDLTMLYDMKSLTCVAGENTNGYGLLFMGASLKQSIDNEFKFQYKSASGKLIDTTSNCDFGGNYLCKRSWEKYNARIIYSYEKPITPITDERWNEFKIYVTNGENLRAPAYDSAWSFISDKFYVGLSIRGTNDAHILLCTSPIPQKGPCYWIIIDGFENTTLSVLRKCITGVPNKWATNEDCREIRSSINNREKFLNDTKWTHFFLAKEKDSIQLWLWDINKDARLLIHYIDVDPLETNYMLLKSYNSIAHWKVHANSYLKIEYQSKMFTIGPTFTFEKYSSICISMYVIMCSECSMSITLESEDNVVITKTIHGNNNTKFLTWKHIKLHNENLSTSSNIRYQLFFQLNNNNVAINDTFWAIDNFRKCSNDEIRVGEIHSYYNVTCHSLKYPNWTFSPEKMKKNINHESPTCSNVTYIGRHCNISCNAVTTDIYCDRKKICLSTKIESSAPACICASGYKWNSECKQECPNGYYGYNCQNECRNCIFSLCQSTTGYCPRGCKDGYVPPYCIETFPYFKNPVKVIGMNYTSVTVKFEYIVIKGAVNLTQFVQLECKEILRKYWANCSAQKYVLNNLKLTINNLKKETPYMIRAVIYTNTGNVYRNKDVPYINVTTSCETIKIINIDRKATNATIHFGSSKYSCSLMSYDYQLKHNNEKLESNQILYNPIILFNLKPYTVYEIIITNMYNSSDQIIKNFTTEQDAPGEISNLKIKNVTDTEITFSWNDPIEKNGIIRKYNITYHLQKRLHCEITPNFQEYVIYVYPYENNTLKIKQLEPYSTYQFQIFAITISTGKSVFFTANTEARDKIYEEEFSDLVQISSIESDAVYLDIKKDCFNQKGPLFLEIIFKCITNVWCSTITYKTSIQYIRESFSVIPFTNYSIEIGAKRTEHEKPYSFKKLTNISTPAKEPPAVKKFSAFSKDNHSISLRWLEPYPPHGHLKLYKIEYCTSGECISKQINIFTVYSCNLWREDYKCYILQHLYTDHSYSIKISALNEESKKYGPANLLKTNTKETESSEPLYVKYTWQNNEFILHWNHPFVTNGQLRKFLITFTQNDTYEQQNDTLVYNYEYNIEKETRKYSLPINLVRFCTSYVITVCGVNSFYGKNATLLINTPPEIPKLQKNIYVDDKIIADNVVTIVVPPLDMNTTTSNCILYVVVSKLYSNITQYVDNNNNNQLKQQIRNNIPLNADSWIAKEITEINTKTIRIFLGSDETTKSLLLNETITNRKLEPDTEYEISIILVNTYKDKMSTSKYSVRVKTSGRFSDLYALFLLLFLIPAGFILYRYIKKKLNEKAYIEANMSTNIYLEVLDDAQYEEPIQVPDIHTYETIQDTPTYMNIKSNSNNIYANT